MCISLIITKPNGEMIMALGASLMAFVFACAAAGVTLFLGFSVVIAVLAYSSVGAVSLLLAVWIADMFTKDAAHVSQVSSHRVTS